MKGILLAGGRGTRLRPLTLAVSKHLLAVYDKPLVYYPLSTLMLAGLRDILVITTPEHGPAYRNLLGDGSQWGVRFTFAEQDEPRGPADAFRVGKQFIDGGPTCLILGDNIFLGDRLASILRKAACLEKGALIFACKVDTPQQYGVVEIDKRGHATRLDEAPAHPHTDYAVPGIYFYDRAATGSAAELQPSERGEYEITDLNRLYLERGSLKVQVLERDIFWLDAGTHKNLIQAGNLVQTIQDRQGVLVGSPEEVAFRMGFIDAAQLSHLAQALGKNDYASRLRSLLSDSGPASKSPVAGDAGTS
jgi:glucose-1-phosphate thymidylyltransferase